MFEICGSGHDGPQRRRFRRGASRSRRAAQSAATGRSSDARRRSTQPRRAAAEALAPGLGAAHRLVEVEAARELADEAVEPADDDLARRGRRRSARPRTRARSSPGQRLVGREVDEVARDVEVEPARRRTPPPAGCRCSGPRRRSRRPGEAGGPPRGSRRPAPGRCSSACQRITAAQVPSPSTCVERLVAEVRSMAELRSRPDRLAATVVQRVDQRAVAGADVEDRPRRRDLVDPRGEQAAGAAEERVAGEREALPGGRAGTSRRRRARAPPGRATGRSSPRRRPRSLAGRLSRGRRVEVRAAPGAGRRRLSSSSAGGAADRDDVERLVEAGLAQLEVAPA